MDIRTKLVFAFAAVTLGSLAAFGFFMNREADTMIDRAAVDQLEGLAESSEAAVESIIDGWEERVRLVASRTQLRISLQDFSASRSPEARARIQRILDDAAASTPTVVSLATYARGGALVAESGGPADSILAALYPMSRAGATGRVKFLGVSFAPDGYPRVAYGTRLDLEGQPVGFLFVLLKGTRLVDLTQERAGMGETGELMIVMKVPAGARTLHPVRAGEPDALGAVLLDGEADPARLALQDEGVFREGLVDYRNQVVWAATRYLPQTGWGLVVKFDEAEKQTSIHAFREELFSLALALAGLGIMVALFLGFRFARPILGLVKVAERLGDGDLEARATVEREDEIGLLANRFNEMAEALKVQVTELHEFQKFFDVSLDMLCIAGTDGYFKRCNPAFERVLGWSGDELTERPFLDLVHPDDVRATEQEIASLAEGIPTISFVNRFRCADGSWKWLRWNSYPDPGTGLLYAIARETRVQPES